MTIVHVGKIVRRAALIGSTTFFSTCAPSSISSPPPMRAVPDGPALAGRRIGLLDPGGAVGVRPFDWPTMRTTGPDVVVFDPAEG